MAPIVPADFGQITPLANRLWVKLKRKNRSHDGDCRLVSQWPRSWPLAASCSWPQAPERLRRRPGKRLSQAPRRQAASMLRPTSPRSTPLARWPPSSTSKPLPATQRVDALLPPYRQMVHRVPDPPLEPAIPRIRYPIAVRPSDGHAAESDGVLHVAEKPQITITEKAPASGPSASVSQQAAGKTGDWLIDPKEWYTPGTSADVPKTSSEPEHVPNVTPPKVEASQPPAIETNSPQPAAAPIDVAARPHRRR